MTEAAVTDTSAEENKSTAESASLNDDPGKDPAPKGDPAPKADDPGGKAANGDAVWANLRKEIAGGDEKVLKNLERYGSLKAFADAKFAGDQKISSGEYKRAEVPTDEAELAEYRKQAGIPDTPEGYVETLDLGEGVLVGEQDQAILDGVMKSAHAGNIPASQLKGLTDAFFEARQAEYDKIAEQDDQGRKGIEDTLRKDWGDDYRPYMQAAGAFLKKYGVADALQHARDGDGKLLMDQPAMMKTILQAALNDPDLKREVDLKGGVPEGAALGEEIAKLKKMIREDPAQWKALGDKGQERLAKLLDAQKDQRG